MYIGVSSLALECHTLKILSVLLALVPHESQSNQLEPIEVK